MTQPHPQEERAFFNACSLGHAALLRDLLERHPVLAHTASTTNGHQTGLHFAAANNRAVLIPYLLGAGADINARDDEGETPLMKSAYYLALNSMTCLLEAGADTRPLNKVGKSVAMLAAEGAAPAAIGLLNLAERQRRNDLALELSCLHQGLAAPLEITAKPLKLSPPQPRSRP